MRPGAKNRPDFQISRFLVLGRPGAKIGLILRAWRVNLPDFLYLGGWRHKSARFPVLRRAGGKIGLISRTWRPGAKIAQISVLGAFDQED